MRRLLATFTLGALLLSVLASQPSARDGDRFLLTQDGLGPLKRGSVVRIDALQARYPELAISTEIFQAEGVDYSRIVGRDGRDVVLLIELEAGKFRDIVLLSPLFSDENGVSVGIPSADAPMRRKACFFLVDGSPYLACPSVGSEQLQYLFDAPPAGGPKLEPPANAPVKGIRLW